MHLVLDIGATPAPASPGAVASPKTQQNKQNTTTARAAD